MISSILLIETASGFDSNSLNISLANAKHIVIGSAPVFGFLVHIAASSPEDMNSALQDFATIRGVTRVSQLIIQQ